MKKKKKGETIMKKNTSTILGIALAVGGAAIEVAKILLDGKSDAKVKDSSK